MLGLRFGRTRIVLAVATPNRRAITVYERAGFVAVRTHIHRTNGGEWEFLEMELSPSPGCRFYAAVRRSSARLRRGRWDAFGLLLARRQDASVEPKCCSSARRRTGPTPSSVCRRATPRARAERRWRGSRAPNGALRPEHVGATANRRRAGRGESDRPAVGRRPPRPASPARSRPLSAQLVRLHRRQRRRELPLPPLRSRRGSGAVALPVVLASTPVRRRANRRETTSAIAAKPSWPSSPCTANLR